MSTSTLLTTEQLVNWVIGRDMIDNFLQRQTIAYKKGGEYYYTTNTNAPRNLNESEWKEIELYEQYEVNNETYSAESFWGVSNKMQREGSDKYYDHKNGTLSYNVPPSTQAPSESDSYYIFTGNEIKANDNKKYALNFYVPKDDSKRISAVSTTPTYQKVKTQDLIGGSGKFCQGGSSLEIDAGQEFKVGYSTERTHSLGLQLNVEYEIKDSIEAGTDDFKESMEESIKEGLTLDLSTSETQTDEGSSTATITSQATVTNGTCDTVTMMYMVPMNESSSTYTVEGILASDPAIDPSKDQFVYYNENKHGNEIKNRYDYTNTENSNVYTVLQNVKNALAESNDDNYIDLSNKITPSEGSIESSGSIASTAPDYNDNGELDVQYWFYNAGNGCYSNSPSKAVSNDCLYNADDIDGAETSRVSRRYQRKANRLFTIAKLKKMHKSEPLGESKIKVNINGEEMDRVIGSKTKTIHTSYAIGSTTHDWHTNDSKKTFGGSILHGGADHYLGNTGRDFVSSKSIDGSSNIATKAGNDVVLIDAKQFNNFTPGRTHLGRGNDTYIYRGSSQKLDADSTHHEKLTTGRGKDKIIVKGNPKLHIDDFNPRRDRLVMDLEGYQPTIHGATVLLTNDNGGSVILRDILVGVDATIDALSLS